MITIYRALSDTKDGLPPFQDEFAHAVADRAVGRDRDAVIARAKRKYPSFVRQHHFELLLREHFAHVRSDDRLDLEDGVDFLITEGGGEYIILLTKDRKTAQLDRKLPKLRRATSAWRDTPYCIIDNPTLPVGPGPHRLLLHRDGDIEEVRRFIREQ